MIEFFKTNEDVAKVLGDKDRANELLNQILMTAYNMAVEHSLRTLPRIVMRQMSFYGEVNRKVVKFFEKNKKYENVKEIFKTKVDMLGVSYPEKKVEELLQLAAVEVDKEFGI